MLHYEYLDAAPNCDGAASNNSSAEENEVHEALQLGLPQDQDIVYYTELIAYLVRGKLPMIFQVDTGNDFSVSIHNTSPFVSSSGFPLIRCCMFDMDVGDWVEIHSRAKIDLSPGLKPFYPFLLVKKAYLDDEDCPGIEGYYQRLGGRRHESTPHLDSLSDFAQREEDAFSLPSPTPLPDSSSLPSFSPIPGSSSPVSGRQSKGTADSHTDGVGSTTFHINTINISINYGPASDRCSHDESLKHADDEDDEEIEVFNVHPRKRVRTE